jgi:2-polyprenyl-3-methyl-5-hydroxy-6-metoxy-1,4-benzoquinol methylase
MNKAECNICKARGFKLISDTDGGDYLLQQEKYYSDSSICFSPLFSYLQSEATNNRLRIIERFLTNGFLFEVGPGNGDVLKLALSKGFKVDAVEYSETLTNSINETLGLQVKSGAFEEEEMEFGVYDAYMSFHVVEHLPDIFEHFKKANQIVRKGGFAFIATPNANSWEHKISFGLSPNYSSAHLELFTPRSLTMSLEKHGWEVVTYITPEYPSSWLRVLTSLIRRMKASQNDIQRGQLMKSTNPKLKKLVYLFSLISYPLRKLQEVLKGGNEIFVIAKKL